MQQRTRTWLLGGVLIALLGLTMGWAVFSATAAPAVVLSDGGPSIMSPVHYQQTDTLSELSSRPQPAVPENKALAAWRAQFHPLPLADRRLGHDHGTRDWSRVQSSAPEILAMPTPIAAFDGIDHHNGSGIPPDTDGAIGWDPATGKKYYFQTVNSAFAIWDVSTPSSPHQIISPTANNVFWNGFGTLCETHNDGDPIVLYDRMAHRWLFSQFAVDRDAHEYHECIAVSSSADPTGTWYAYDYQFSKFNDYPHFGVWPDGYYMTVNQFNDDGSWGGEGVVAFEREKMLAGQSAREIYFDLGDTNLFYAGLLPSDLEGNNLPPAGTPNFFMEWVNVTGIGNTDALYIWEFHVDWATPSNSTFGSNAQHEPNAIVGTADVDPNMCDWARNCIPQPNGNGLDAISEWLMYRLAFRVLNDGTFTVVGNHTVDVDGNDHAGIHWFQLHYDGSAWSMGQEGVYAPDAKHRWMASAATDKLGDLALGFSVSSSSVYPSIAYAGRLASDAAGILAQGEHTLVSGSGSQETANRWGDYSALTLDPQDDCTFWYTQEYIAEDGFFVWKTHIGAFAFDACLATVLDNDLSATPMTLSRPQRVQQNAAYASFDADDPTICGHQAYNTLWYTWTPTADRKVGFDTFASNFDTLLGVYTRSGDAFNPVACNDDAASTTQSHVSFQAQANTTYYIVAGAKAQGAAGDLHLHLSSFPDVTGDAWYWKYVEGLVAQGVTLGYEDGTYRPSNHVTRAEMAVFLLRSIHGSSYSPPHASSYSFSDISGCWAADWIEEAKQEGLVKGYPDGTYRPGNPVTRAESAALLLKGKYGGDYTPPEASSYSFSDIDDHWAADWIEDLHQKGFANGYPDGTYRPNNPVTRAEMATMLDSVFGFAVPNLTP